VSSKVLSEGRAGPDRVKIQGRLKGGTREKETQQMEDDTRRGSVVPLIAPNDGGWNTPDNSARQIQGTLLTYADKQYFAGGTKSREEVPIGTRLVAVAIRAGWKRWEGKKVAEFVQQIAGRYPARHQLGHTDEAKWPRGRDGKSVDPWQDSREVVLVNQDDYTEFTFCTSSGGGRAAVDALRNSVANARLLRPGQFPIVELGWKPMNTHYGTKSKPSLKIVDWWKPDATPIAPTDNDLNDKIPDLTK
jgi:hypothetical protein